MSNGILVFIEHKGGVANKSSIEAIAAAQKLGSELQQSVSAVVLGNDISALAQEIAGYDVEKVICATNEKLADYTPDAYADGFEQIVNQAELETQCTRQLTPQYITTKVQRLIDKLLNKG